MLLLRPLRTPVLALLLALPALGDEGQWTPEQPAAFDSEKLTKLRTRGLALTPQELWDGKGGGLLTAAVNLAGCSGAFVSSEGLFLTNHHCAFAAIQLASTTERNYLRDGFVARTRAEEVPARGGASTVLVMSRIVDVTAKVRGPKSRFARAKTDLERYEAVEQTRKELVRECERKPGSRCQVEAFYDGLEFRLQEQTELQDVRLVYAPPRAVGEYGGEEDNFRFPRHTGDFSVLRAYVAPNGSSATYSDKNVPYKPARFLKVSDQGVAPGELVMILGYPGRTQRYLSASAVKTTEEWLYPTRAETYRHLIEILESVGAKDRDAALRLSSAIKTYGNSETNARGQIAGLRRNDVKARAEREGTALREYLAGDPKASAAWKAAPDALEALLTEERKLQERVFWLGEVDRLYGTLGAAVTAVRFAEERRKPDLARDAGYQDRDLQRAKDKAKDLGKSLVPLASRKALAYVGSRLLKLDGGSGALEAAFGKAATEDAIEQALTAMDGTSTLRDDDARVKLFSLSYDELAKLDDPYVTLALSLARDLAAVRVTQKELAGRSLRVRADYLAALRTFRATTGRPIYPDANRTLRISFAEVRGYSPREATVFLPQTTVMGLLEKETGAEPFASPARVLEKVREKDFGPYLDQRLEAVPVCFLSDGDTTGGNSGSPTVNGRGELVGLNFDRVWENVAGDFGWSPAYSRNVNVDIRYALWLIDRVDGAAGLVKEILPGR